MLLADRQRSEQNFTLSQSRAHFFRHENGRPQLAQILDGKSDLLIIRGTATILQHVNFDMQTPRHDPEQAADVEASKEQPSTPPDTILSRSGFGEE